MRRQNRQFARHQAYRTLANDYAAIASLFIGIVGKVEDKLGFTEYSVEPLVNCRPIVSRPLDHLIERLVERGGAIDQGIDVAGFIS